MPIINEDGTPLVELTAVTDFYADGIHRLEVMGETCRVIYFRWRFIDGIWQRICADCARIMPVSGLTQPLASWPHVKVGQEPAPDLGSRH